jgi:hypothetical protein
MLALIEDAEQIAKAQKRIVETIRREFKATLVKNIGYPGGTTRDARIFTNGKHWFWSSDHHQADAPNPRRLNWFGILREGTHQERSQLKSTRCIPDGRTKSRASSREIVGPEPSTCCTPGALVVARREWAKLHS